MSHEAMEVTIDQPYTFSVQDLQKKLSSNAEPSYTEVTGSGNHDGLARLFGPFANNGRDSRVPRSAPYKEQSESSTPRRPIPSRNTSDECGKSDTTSASSSYIYVSRDTTPVNMSSHPSTNDNGDILSSDSFEDLGDTGTFSDSGVSIPDLNGQNGHNGHNGIMADNSMTNVVPSLAVPITPAPHQPVRSAYQDVPFPMFPPVGYNDGSTCQTLAESFNQASETTMPRGIPASLSSMPTHPSGLRFAPVVRPMNSLATNGTPRSFDFSQFPSQTATHAPFSFGNSRPERPMLPVGLPPRSQQPTTYGPGIGDILGDTADDQISRDASQYVEMQFSFTQRHGQACSLCKIKKIKCDNNPLGCGNCRKIRQRCHDLNRITGKCEPRGQGHILMNQVRALRRANQTLSRSLRKLQKAELGNSSTLGDLNGPPVLEPKFALMMWLKFDKKDFWELEHIFHELTVYSPPKGSPANWQSLYTAITGLLGLLKRAQRPNHNEFADLKQDVNLLLKSLESEEEQLEDGTSFIMDIQEALGMMVAEIMGLPSQAGTPSAAPSRTAQNMATLNQPVPTHISIPNDEEEAPIAPQPPIRPRDS